MRNAGTTASRRTTNRPIQAESPPKRKLTRLVIEDVEPDVDGGRFQAKRLVGDRVDVRATVHKDGHDLVSGRICYRGPGDRTWRYAPMTYDRDFDLCAGSFEVDRVGAWMFTVEAWSDVFGTWQTELRKKFAAGSRVELELREGAALVEQARRAATGGLQARLKEIAAALRDESSLTEERVRAGSSDDLGQLMKGHVDRTTLTRWEGVRRLWVDRERAGFAAWYEMFPRSQSAAPGVHGTFADAERRLPELAELGFDVVYLPPIHPIGTTHRKGPNNTLQAGPDDPGSPWAIGSREGGHAAVEPKLGTFKDFERFVRTANGLGMEVALDYALQCSPDHPWVREHPDWFFHRADGSIQYAENPPKKYEDIYPLNFWCDDYRALWRACRDILLFWIGKGVRVFRVDNPHTKPYAFWEWVIGDIREGYPEVIFLSEAFTRPARMKCLAKLGFTQSYTYFTWRNTAWELREYLTELTTTRMVEYFRPNFFVNTPDILHEYLQTGGRPAFRVRLLLAATLSPAYGMYSGFELCENRTKQPGSEEYLNSEKYEIRVRDWDAPGNIKKDIGNINRIRRENPALRRLANLSFHPTENERILFYRKRAPGNELLIVVNLDPHHAQETMVRVPLAEMGIPEDQPYEVHDLLTGDRYIWTGVRNYVRLDPAQQVGHLFRVNLT